MRSKVVPEKKKFAWFLINSDGLFIAMLAIITGLFDILQPDYMDLQEKIGQKPISYYIWSVLYITGGLLMAFGFIRQKIAPELFGRLLTILAAGLEAGRIAIAFGFFSSEVYSRYVLFWIIVTFFAMRAYIILGDGGVAVIVGGKVDNS